MYRNHSQFSGLNSGPQRRPLFPCTVHTIHTLFIHRTCKHVVVVVVFTAAVFVVSISQNGQSFRVQGVLIKPLLVRMRTKTNSVTGADGHLNIRCEAVRLLLLFCIFFLLVLSYVVFIQLPLLCYDY